MDGTTPDRGTRGLLLVILGRISVPLMILAFAGAFAYSARALPFISAGYPRFLIALLVPIVLAIIVREILAVLRGRRQAMEGVGTVETLEMGAGSVQDAGWRSWIPVAVVGTWLVALVLAMPRIGVMPTVAMFVPGVLVSLGFRRWLAIVAITAATLLTIHVLFVRIFALPLPGVW